MWKSKWVRRLAWAVTDLMILGAALAIYFRDAVEPFVEQNSATFKLVGLAIAPFLAVLGFVWGALDKIEIKELAEELGQERERAEKATKSLSEAQSSISAKTEQIKSLESNLETIADSQRLWRLGPPRPFPEYEGWKLNPHGARIVSVGLFKGGVGKTHLTANFAAYISEKLKKKVLLIDLDYQGSLSTIMFTAAGIEPTESKVDSLLAADADLATLSRNSIQLVGNSDLTILNGGKGLSRAWIVPADYSLSALEGQLLVSAVMKGPSVVDERYRLARVLLHPDVRNQYAMILIDTPPRMSLGTVNALIASHAYVVPTILDRVSSEAIGPFLSQIQSFKSDLKLEGPELAGIVGSMTKQMPLTGKEPDYRKRILATATEQLKTDMVRTGRPLMLDQNIPRKAAITNKDDLGYFLDDGHGQLLRDLFYDKVFDDLWSRIVESTPNH
jgi:cellulose biosynthesis protein BcsQ